MQIKTKKSAKFFDGYRTAARLAAACASDGAHIEHDEARGSYDLIVPATGEKLSLLAIMDRRRDDPYTEASIGLTTPWARHYSHNKYTAWDHITADPDALGVTVTLAYSDLRATGAAEKPCTNAFLRERIRLCCIAYRHLATADATETIVAAEVAA